MNQHEGEKMREREREREREEKCNKYALGMAN